ncbi:zinc finger MYM-type protein 4-like [Perca flavescens]|uniref:zinc finger MYM-type protein 4-like n=1 Tax=Perca flavescens TaxID=8167 RepID=UPI00106E6C78|nr:zinc finger MYM-type protein 4-like [Perca flavescens]
MGNSLKNIGGINFARALKEDADKETIHEAETFIDLCAKEWRRGPSSKTNVNNLPTIPFIHDVQLFYQCLEKTAASAVQSLTMYECSPVYSALLRVTLAQMSVLNTNMAKVSKATLKSFKERDETELHEDAAVSQSQFEQILSKHTVKINIETESGQKVAVTLTPKILTAMTLLVNKRDACGVHENNPFLFARPNATCSSFQRGHQCAIIFASRCGAKSTANLRSVIFHKHLARLFLILSLTNDDLDQLAKLLGRDIQTDREYYQTPEAAVDVAKISALLSAFENGSLQKFEGKSLEEIEIPDELEPDVQDNSENSEAEEDNEKSESSLSGLPFTKGSLLGTKKTCRASMSRKRSRGRRKRQKSETEASELNDDKDTKVNREKDDGSDEMPVNCAVNTPEKTAYRSNEDATHMSFSDGDDDMNVDFDMDTDDDVRNEENDEDGDTTGSAATPLIPDVTKQDEHSSDTKKNDSSPYKHTSVADLEETMDIDTVNNVERRQNQKKGGKQNDWIDVASRSFSDFLNTEKKNKLSAAVIGMKEVKILIPKLDIEKFQASVKSSQLSSEYNSVKSPVKDPPIHEDNNQGPTSSPSTDVQNKPSYAKASKMNCSHCKKSMMKGQTAYQKKGFTDVFCSKNCLFEMFPINKPVTKTCHYCLKAISQPLDLIMAAVDIKGTMKDFCSTTCLLSFKSNTGSTQTPQRLCSMCNESCTTTCELTLNEAVHTFCGDSCLDDFRRDNMAVCENCSSNCRNKPLKLELEEETKTICSHECLDEFKEKIETLHQCTMCHTSQTISDMVDYKNDNNVVKLFCNRNCVTSYKLRPATVYKLQEKKSSDQLKKGKKGQQLNPKDVKISQDSTVNENDAPAAAELDNTSTFIIEASCVACCNCGQRLPRGETHYQPKSSLDVFCSAKCLSERHPHSKLATKNCYNCFQVIMRPQNIILAPVDDSGTMKELCSDTCLASVNSKRTGPWSECKMCAKYCYCKFRMTLDGLMQRICSDCFINYQRINNLPVPICDVCGSVGLGKRILLKVDDSSKTICSEECLIKFKEKVRAPQLCPMCQTSHHLSDMVEKKNDKGMLDFYCSNRCMMVHKAQSSTVSGRMSLSPQEDDIKDVKPSISPEENDIKEVKPSIPNLDCIKEEPIDEEYNQNLPSSISTENIKDEPKAGDDVAKEDLKIGSVFSLTGNLSTPTSTAPTLAHMDLPASCSNCKQVLVDGETVYQRKGHADIFCSTPCLLKCYQMKQVKKTCHFCLQGIAPQQDILQAPVDNEGTMKDFCNQSCLSSFSYKNIMSTKIPLVPVSSQSQCSMCSRYFIRKHEIIQEDVVHKICSDPCFLRFCNINNLSICENCHSPCKTPVMLKMEDGSKKLCGAECLAQFKRKIKTPHPCAMCHTAHLISDMFENKNGEDVVELFCTSSCVMASKIQAVSASGTPLNCDHCGRTTLPACHLAMSDSSIRNFCTLTCAMSFKESQKDMAANSTGAADPTQCDFLKPPEKLPCAQCRRIIKASPKVIQKKGKMYFVCGLSCCQEFNRVNNIMGKCKYCNNERIIRHVQKFDGKDQDFCSDGCKRLFQHELENKWGKHCGWCAYCFSFSKTVVTAKYEGADKDFCSENCSSNYKMLLCHVAKCDTCGLNGKLRQSLPMLGEVKHFCDLRCLLHFCNKKVQMVNTVSSPPRSSGTVESFPVIANVISLASALARQTSTSASSAQHGLHTQTLFSVPDIQTKVVGHASVQTVPKEMKNKSMLCTPLVHNKGVSCTTQTVDTEAQTDNFVPKVIVLPVPVPVYVPLPMNMYSQYTPTPLGLPLPLPVPVFLPDPTVKVTKERIPPDPLEEELNLKSERKKVQDEKNKREHRVVTKEGRRQEVHAPKEHSSNYSEDFDSDHQATFNNQKDSSSDTSFGSLSRPNTHKKTPRFLEVGMHREPQPELPPPALEMRGDPQGSPSAESAPMLLQQTVGKVHNKNKGRKLQQSSRAAEEEASQREKVMSRKLQKLESQCGIAAWKRWIQWRKSQTNLDLVSYHAVTLNEDVLRCSASELSDSLCCFITEVKRPDGEPYSPDSLFYLCLSIQQYLFENERMENIFSDLIYNKFSTKFNNILKGFKPSISASGYIHSRVEEEFLWDCKQLGAYSPIVLLNTLLFFCCKYFGFTTVEQHRQLSFAHVMRCTKTNQNNTKTTFLRFYPPVSINKPEPDVDGVPAKKRKKKESMEMMENTENPLRCPIRLYEFYLSKCSESLRQHTDLFYLSPDGRCVPNSPLWFSSTPLDDGPMEAMLVRILAIRELQGGDRRGVDQRGGGDTRFVPDEEDLE